MSSLEGRSPQPWRYPSQTPFLRARAHSSLHGILSASFDIGSISFNTTKVLPLKRARWSIGTLAFSIVLVTSETVPQLIGWLGIVTSILVGTSTGIKLSKLNFKDFTVLGGLSAILFEVIIGGWLLFLQ